MALSALDALVLAVVQGITEWLPISSSAHLALAQRLLGVDVPVAYDLWLHVGTLLAVILYYRKRLGHLILAALRGPKAAKETNWKAAWLDDVDRRLALTVVIGTIPIVIAGVLFKDLIESTFNSLAWIAWTFIANAILLALAGVRKPTHPLPAVRIRDGAAAGGMQVLALLPALSRSGCTIVGGMWSGLDRHSAADLSFLLSVPALAGAVVFETPELLRLGALGWMPIVIGFVGTFVVGYATIAGLLAWVRRHSLLPFAAYSLVAGIVVLLWMR